MATHNKTLEVLAPVSHAGGGLLRKLLAMAIDGVGPLPGAKSTAAQILSRTQDPEQAIESLIRQHVALAGAQGFVTNIGGFATLPITVPTNLTGVAMVNVRLAACVAHLRGYDIDDNRVRSAIAMCLLGPRTVEKLADSGLPSTPLLVATAPLFDANLDQRISEHVLAELAGQVGGTKAISLVGRRIPIVGGGVGAALDGWSTWTLASYVKEVLVDRRPRP